MPPTPEFRVLAIDVHRVEPDATDRSNLEFLSQTEAVENDVFLVRVHTSGLPPASPLGIEFRLGDYAVRKFSEWNGGVYFKVYNPRFFTKHGGKPLRVSVDGIRFEDTGLVFPSSPPEKAPHPHDAARLLNLR